MQCPRCESTQLRKNGHSSGKQRYLCKACGRQFLEPLSSPSLPNTESEAVQVALNGHSKAAFPEGSPPMLNVKEASEGLGTRGWRLVEPDSNCSSVAEVEDSLVSSPQSLVPSQSVPQLDRAVTPAQGAAGIAILLLDAENLKLDINAEKFLDSISTYPLQVLIAFANWRNPSIGRQDAELYERGYQLVHVPGGKNSADAQMIAMGASISRHYPDAKEVFVCSSDWLLTNLCNELKSLGLTVYRVRRQDHSLSVENRNTGKIHYYSLTLGTEIPSFEGLVKKMEELLQAEHESINARIAHLSTIATLFQERCNFTLNGTRSNASSVVEQQQDSITPVPDDESIEPLAEKKAVDSKTSAETMPNSEATTIKSRAELEKAILQIIQSMQTKSPKTKISTVTLSTEFKNIYGQTPNSIIKQLKLGSNLSKFLQSSPAFTLKQNGKAYDIAVCVVPSEGTLAQSSLHAEIRSRTELEQVLVNIVKTLTAQSPQKQITIEILGSEFHKQYSQSVAGIIKQLNLNGTFPQFIHCCSAFNVEKKGKVYQVTVRPDK
jgi:hypothetical protein